MLCFPDIHKEDGECRALHLLVAYFPKNIVQLQANQEDTCLHEGCCCFYRKLNSGSVMRMRGSGGLPALVFVAV